MSELNYSDEVRLPQLIEVYDLQKAGLVGQSSFKERPRPASVDEGEMEHLRQQRTSEQPKGVLPAFGEKSTHSDLIPMGSTGSFRSKPQVQAHRIHRGRQSQRELRSPAEMEPWSGSAAEILEGSFDILASAPAYRPGKVIRSLESSFKSKAPRPTTVNPRLNAFEVAIDQATDLETNRIDVVNWSQSEEFGTEGRDLS